MKTGLAMMGAFVLAVLFGGAVLHLLAESVPLAIGGVGGYSVARIKHHKAISRGERQQALTY